MKKVYIYNLLLLILTLGVFQSCDKADEINTVGLKVYVNTGISPINNYSFHITHTPTTSVANYSELKFPLKTTRASIVDILGEVEIDNDIIDAYNEANGTKFEKCPEGLFQMSKSVTIKAGNAESSDSIKFELTDLTQLKSISGYMVPIKISNIQTSDIGAQISSNMNFIYLFITAETNNIDLNATTIDGDVIDKSDWSVEAVGTYNATYKAENAIDGSNISVWFYTATRNPSITIDMSREQIVKGLRLVPNYNAFNKTYAFKRFEVDTSLDGTTWAKHGKSNVFEIPVGSASSPDYRVVKFYSQVNARFIRLRMTENHAGWGGISEIEAFK